ILLWRNTSLVRCGNPLPGLVDSTECGRRRCPSVERERPLTPPALSSEQRRCRFIKSARFGEPLLLEGELGTVEQHQTLVVGSADLACEGVTGVEMPSGLLELPVFPGGEPEARMDPALRRTISELPDDGHGLQQEATRVRDLSPMD